VEVADRDRRDAPVVSPAQGEEVQGHLNHQKRRIGQVQRAAEQGDPDGAEKNVQQQNLPKAAGLLEKEAVARGHQPAREQKPPHGEGRPATQELPQNIGRQEDNQQLGGQRQALEGGGLSDVS